MLLKCLASSRWLGSSNVCNVLVAVLMQTVDDVKPGPPRLAVVVGAVSTRAKACQPRKTDQPPDPSLLHAPMGHLPNAESHSTPEESTPFSGTTIEIPMGERPLLVVFYIEERRVLNYSYRGLLSFLFSHSSW